MRKAFAGTLLLVALVGVSAYVFAIDGVFSISGKSKKASFSSIRKDLQFSLNSGFSFHQQKTVGGSMRGSTGVYNSVLSYQKGNVTYYFPYKHRPILPKFKTPTAPSNR